MKKIFISYSHKDESWKDRLVTHLNVLQRQGLLSVWQDRQIRAGGKWYGDIETALNEAGAAILLVSANFLGSDFILREEIPRLLQRRANEGTEIFPLIVTPCAWDKVSWLVGFQVRPRDGRPLSGGTEYQIDTDLTAFVKEVTHILSQEQGQQTPQALPVEAEPPAPTKRFPNKRHRFTALIAIFLIVGLALTGYFLSRVPPEVKTHLKSGEQSLNQGLYADAEKHFQQAMQRDRWNAEAQKGLKKIELYRLVHSDRDPVAVETEIRQFLKRHPDDPHAYMLWGDLFANSEPRTAIKHYQKAIDIDPDLPEAWFSLGYVYATHRKDYDTALVNYRRAATLSLHNSRYLTNLAGTLCKLDRFQACLDNYKKAIDLHPNSFMSHMKLIEGLLLSGQFDEAAPYAKALAQWTEDETVWAKPINQELWGLEVEDRNGMAIPIQLEDVNEKEFYVLCQISLTFCLLDHEAEAREYARKARAVQFVDEDFLIKLVAWDIQRLKQHQPEFGARLDKCWSVLSTK
jgi:tetratricopeptide (TPR) repeat protein